MASALVSPRLHVAHAFRQLLARALGQAHVGCGGLLVARDIGQPRCHGWSGFVVVVYSSSGLFAMAHLA